MAIRGVKDVYLVLYNLVQTVGWSMILYNVIMNYVNEQGPEMVWPKVGELLIIFQNAAVLEVVHSMIGLVRSPVMTTFIQVLSRVMITYVCMVVPICRVGYIFSLLMASWSIIEIVRYSFYAFSIVGINIYVHTWLRYTLFIVLYPSGVFSEIGTLYLALPYIKEHGLFGVSDYVVFPPFTFWELVVYFLIFIYLPGFPVMFGHMVKQRKKVIGGGNRKVKTK